jgi:Helix-turn-helix domain
MYDCKSARAPGGDDACGSNTGGFSTQHMGQGQLAQRWGLSPRTLERWRWLKLGPAYIKIGGRVRYRLKDVLAYEASQLRGDR